MKLELKKLEKGNIYLCGMHEWTLKMPCVWSGEAFLYGEDLSKYRYYENFDIVETCDDILDVNK